MVGGIEDQRHGLADPTDQQIRSGDDPSEAGCNALIAPDTGPGRVRDPGKPMG